MATKDACVREKERGAEDLGEEVTPREHVLQAKACAKLVMDINTPEVPPWL